MRRSNDIRKRVVEFVRSGGSKAEAARRFQVGEMSVRRWCNASDPYAYNKPGPKGARNVDRQALTENVEAQNDMTQQERARRFGVSRHCIWYNLQQLKISRKKNEKI